MYKRMTSRLVATFLVASLSLAPVSNSELGTYNPTLAAAWAQSTSSSQEGSPAPASSPVPGGSPVPASSSVVSDSLAKEIYFIGEGIEHHKYTGTLNQKKMVINQVEFDLANPFLELRTINPGSGVRGQENILAQANRLVKAGETVVAAINADFYSGSIPMGLQIRDGELLLGPGQDTFFGFDSELKPFIDKAEIQGFIMANKELGQSLKLRGLNKARTTNALVMYTPAFGASTRTNEQGTEVLLEGVALPIKANQQFIGKVVEKKTGEGNMAIPKTGVVLSGNGLAEKYLLEALEVGDEVIFSYAMLRTDVKEAVGGITHLVKAGQIADDTEMSKLSHAKQRNPRTAIGFTGTKMYMVTVDGRQTGVADGITLPELANYLVGLGVQEALNLDGGGSTTLVTRRPGEFELSLANVPSDGNMRPVANGLALISKAPVGEMEYLFPKTPFVTITAEESQQLSILAQDVFFNPVKVDPAKVEWSVTSGLGKINAEGLFTAGPKAAKGVIKAKYEGRETFITVEVLPKEVPLPIITFEDVNESSFPWAKTDIERLASLGVVNGRAENQYVPAGQVTRAEFAAMLVRLLKLETKGTQKQFADVKEGDWHYSFIQGAVAKGLLEGYPDGSFLPSKPINRVEMGIILGRALALQGKTEKDPSLLEKFADFGEIPKWAHENLSSAVKNELIRGRDANRFAPKELSNRAEAAVVLNRLDSSK